MRGRRASGAGWDEEDGRWGSCKSPGVVLGVLVALAAQPGDGAAAERLSACGPFKINPPPPAPPAIAPPQAARVVQVPREALDRHHAAQPRQALFPLARRGRADGVGDDDL